MAALELDGQINENGDLEVHLPDGLPAVKVRVRIDFPDSENKQDEEPWTDEEIREMLTPRRKTMKEVIEWLDANPPTEEWGGMNPEDDPAAFIHNLRRQNQVILEDPEEPK